MMNSIVTHEHRRADICVFTTIQQDNEHTGTVLVCFVVLNEVKDP